MKRYLVLFSALLLFFGLSGIANAYSINNDYRTNGNEFISPYDGNTGFVTETFNNAVPSSGGWTGLLWNWSGNGTIVSGTTGINAAPMGVDHVNRDATQYGTVPQDISTTPLSADASLGAKYNYLGLWWGSVDEYNKLQFFNNGVLVATVNGLDVNNPANGDQTAYATNKYVNILGVGWFDSFRITSTNYAFEFDNITVGVVPEPTSLLLLGLGLMGISGIRRKFKK
jgi:hypothetical protein